MEGVSTWFTLLSEANLETKVAHDADCPFVKYTGIVFPRCDYTDDCPEGVPVAYQKYLYNSRYIVVDISPTLLIKSISWGGSKQICVVYEKLGVNEEDLVREQQMIDERERDIREQLKAWSDMRDVLRTETSPHPTRMPEPFLEDDYIARDYDVWD